MKLIENFQSFIQSAKINQQPFGSMAYGSNPRKTKKKLKLGRRHRRPNHQEPDQKA